MISRTDRTIDDEMSRQERRMEISYIQSMMVLVISHVLLTPVKRQISLIRPSIA